MYKVYQIVPITFYFLLFFMFSCNKKKVEVNNLSAYFGGEIANAKANYLLLYKNDKIIDTLYLDKYNKFGKKFNFLSPGMYIIKHGTLTKYVYFDKNDSLHLHINTKDFENASSFYGDGKDKNNFLLEMFSQSKADRDLVWDFYSKPYTAFRKSIDSLKDIRTAFYLRRKTEIGWSNTFDAYAKAIIDFDYYTRLESYPYAHKNRTDLPVTDSLPDDYYDFRSKINLNDERFSEYKPFTRYLAVRLNSILDHKKFKSVFDESIAKLGIVDSLIADEKVKNRILNNVAFQYFIEDQDEENNTHFLKTYKALVKDTVFQREIFDIKKSIHFLAPRQSLPFVDLIDTKLNPLILKDTLQEQTVIFFWTKNALNHFNQSQQKALQLIQSHKNLTFLSINIDSDRNSWQKLIINRPKHPKIIEAFASDFDQLCDQWFITRLNRTLIVHQDGSIQNAFTSLLAKDFNKEL